MLPGAAPAPGRCQARLSGKAVGPPSVLKWWFALTLSTPAPLCTAAVAAASAAVLSRHQRRDGAAAAHAPNAAQPRPAWPIAVRGAGRGRAEERRVVDVVRLLIVRVLEVGVAVDAWGSSGSGAESRHDIATLRSAASWQGDRSSQGGPERAVVCTRHPAAAVPRAEAHQGRPAGQRGHLQRAGP
jgi:hypothetical protein